MKADENNSENIIKKRKGCIGYINQDSVILGVSNEDTRILAYARKYLIRRIKELKDITVEIRLYRPENMTEAFEIERDIKSMIDDLSIIDRKINR